MPSRSHTTRNRRLPALARPVFLVACLALVAIGFAPQPGAGPVPGKGLQASVAAPVVIRGRSRRKLPQLQGPSSPAAPRLARRVRRRREPATALAALVPPGAPLAPKPLVSPAPPPGSPRACLPSAVARIFSPPISG